MQGLWRIAIVSVLLLTAAWITGAQTLEVKAGREAIVKSGPFGNAAEIARLEAGTRVTQIGDAPRYYAIAAPDGLTGWSYKGHFTVVSATSEPVAGGGPAAAETLLARSDVLKIVVIDVEVGDATLIICPEEDGRRDVILIDTGEDDADRIREELVSNGIPLHGKPVTRFIITHYDHDHFGDAARIVPLAETVYDHGNNIKPNHRDWYLDLVNQPQVDRRTMTLDYVETFSGGVAVECVAVNRATDCDPDRTPAPPEEDNTNSIALILRFDGFDYFTAGDLTFDPERSLADCIGNCDVYHVNHHGSSTTSSDEDFVIRLDPEVSIASNGTRYGHPRAAVAERLLGPPIDSKFFQTNATGHHKAHQPPAQFVADDTFLDDSETEDAEGAQGTIRLVVDPVSDHYYVLMPGLGLSEGTFEIED